MEKFKEKIKEYLDETAEKLEDSRTPFVHLHNFYYKVKELVETDG